MIRVAIIGAGIGREHLAGYRALPAQFAVRTVCDLDTARATQMVAEVAGTDAGIAIAGVFEDVLADPEIDLVDVCLPPHLHLSAALAALDAGKHVVCEKPLVASLADADRLAAAASKAGRIVAPVFQYRFGPAIAQLQALMDAGLTGKAYGASIETHWNRGADYYAVPWRGTWAGENGGCVLGHAIHNHDLLTALLGPVARVSAMVATRVNDIETEDCAAISFAMESGALATSSITLGAATDTTRIRLAFAGLTAQSGTAPYAPATDPWVFTARNPADQGRVDGVLAGVGDVQAGFAGYFAELAKALAGQPNRAVTLADGRRSLELVTAIYGAARTGATVDLPIGPGAPLYDGWTPEPR